MCQLLQNLKNFTLMAAVNQNQFFEWSENLMTKDNLWSACVNILWVNNYKAFDKLKIKNPSNLKNVYFHSKEFFFFPEDLFVNWEWLLLIETCGSPSMSLQQQKFFFIYF